MKFIKVIIGFLLLYGAGKEYAYASKELGTFFSPGILFGSLLLILLCTWLIGSGLSKTKLSFRSWRFIIALVISMVTFAFIALFSLLSNDILPDNVEVNNITVNIAPCMDGSRRIVPDEDGRREYCTCIAQKLTASEIFFLLIGERLKRGDSRQ